MFRSVAGVAQTESGYEYCCTGKTPISSKSCTGFNQIYIGIIHFVAQTTADYSNFDQNVALTSLHNLPYSRTRRFLQDIPYHRKKTLILLLTSFPNCKTTISLVTFFLKIFILLECLMKNGIN